MLKRREFGNVDEAVVGDIDAVTYFQMVEGGELGDMKKIFVGYLSGIIDL